MRNPKIYEKKLSAHNGLALTIDWHPGGRFLASGGRDRVIKIWDMATDSRKPFHYLQTIASVARVQWRPDAPAMTASGETSMANHLASCSLLSDSRIHIWNIDRPYVPFYSFDDHTNMTTGFLWHDARTLYSVGKDRLFVVNRLSAAGPLNLVENNDPGDDVLAGVGGLSAGR